MLRILKGSSSRVWPRCPPSWLPPQGWVSPGADLQRLPCGSSALWVPATFTPFSSTFLGCDGNTGCEIRAEGGNRYPARAEESQSVPGTGSSPWEQQACDLPQAGSHPDAGLSHLWPLGCCPARPLLQGNRVSSSLGVLPKLPGPAASEPLCQMELGARKLLRAFPCPAGQLTPWVMDHEHLA